MRKLFTLLIFIMPAIALTLGCENDYKPAARGAQSEVLVVMDSSRWNTATYVALQETFGNVILTMPRPQPRYDLRFTGIRTNRDFENIKRHKNVIIVATIDEETIVGQLIRGILSDDIKDRIRTGQNFAFPLRDRWYRDQWVLFLSANTDEELAQRIINSEQRLVSSLEQVELQRWTNEVYRRGDQPEISSMLWENYGFTMRVQHDYNVGADTVGFVSLRRYLPDNDRWIWISWKDDVRNIDHIDVQWINARRDSLLNRHIRGSRENSYVMTDYRRPLEISTTTINDKFTWETRGIWRMQGDAMAGPFINYTMYDDRTNRLYMVEYAQFSPRFPQRDFLYQFQSMIRTFRSDETFDTGSYPDFDPFTQVFAD
jgi:hypothetical protein